MQKTEITGTKVKRSYRDRFESTPTLVRECVIKLYHWSILAGITDLEAPQTPVVIGRIGNNSGEFREKAKIDRDPAQTHG